jgi:hypothetical protein
MSSSDKAGMEQAVPPAIGVSVSSSVWPLPAEISRMQGLRHSSDYKYYDARHRRRVVEELRGEGEMLFVISHSDYNGQRSFWFDGSYHVYDKAFVDASVWAGR